MAGHVVERKTYYTITAALMALLVLTLVVAWLPLGPALANVAALTVAIVKAMLVALFFMHVRWGSPLMRLFAVAGVLWLLILMTLTAGDYLTRPQRPERAGDREAATVMHRDGFGFVEWGTPHARPESAKGGIRGEWLMSDR